MQQRRTLILLAVVLFLLVPFGCWLLAPRSGSLKMPVVFREAAFVELVYEQGFAPLPAVGMAFQSAEWNRHERYFFQPVSGQLFTNDGRETTPPARLLVGERVWFHHRLWPHSFHRASQLHALDGSGHQWPVAERPKVADLGEFDGLCQVRADLQVAVELDRERAKITVGKQMRSLAPGESATFAIAENRFEVAALAATIQQRLGLSAEEVKVTPELLLQRRGVLGLAPGSTTITRQARVTATFYGVVRFGDTDLSRLAQKAHEALSDGDFEMAAQRFQTLANILPEDEQVLRMLATATSPPEALKGEVTLSGKITYPAGTPANLNFPPYLEAADQSPAAAAGSPAVAYLAEPDRYRIRLKPALYRVSLHVPGHAVASFEIDLRGNESHDISLTPSP